MGAGARSVRHGLLPLSAKRTSRANAPADSSRYGEPGELICVRLLLDAIHRICQDCDCGDCIEGVA